MANFVFNIAKGRVAYYSTLPATNDALILIPLETTGLEADATLRDYDDVATLLAGSSNEQTTMGRKTISSGVTVTVDDTANTVTVDFADQTYTAATGNAVSAFIIAYDPDTTGGTDSTLIPLTKHDVTLTPDGNNVDVRLPSGFYTA